MSIKGCFGASGSINFSRYEDVFEIYYNSPKIRERFITRYSTRARKKIQEIRNRKDDGYYQIYINDGKISYSYAGTLESMKDFVSSIGKKLVEFERSPLLRMIKSVFEEKVIEEESC